MQPNEPLTDRQQQVLDFLRKFIAEHGYAPSSREIQHGMGFSSQSVAEYYLTVLERRGVIERARRKARGVTLKDAPKPGRLLTIPLYGTIPAGLPVSAEQESDACLNIDADTLELPANARTFALRVRGDSMVNAGILDGDSIILEFRDPQHGDIVAALIDGETTLKRYLVKHRRPYLKAENPKYPDLIPAHELVVQGVMVALLRIPHSRNRPRP